MDYNYTPLQDHSYEDNNKPQMKISSNLKEKMPKIKRPIQNINWCVKNQQKC